MIIAIWETIKRTIVDLAEWVVGVPPYARAFENHIQISGTVEQNPVVPPGSIWIQNKPSSGELCPYCNSRGIGMNGYCVGCGHDRGPRQPQEIAASITDSFILGSRIEIEVTQ